MKSSTSIWLKALPIFCFSFNAVAFDFFENFEGPISPSAWKVSGNPGYSIQFTGGNGSFTKANGIPDGSATLTTAFSVDGDFSVSVDADGRFDGALSEVLKVSWANTTSFAQIYLESPQQTYQQLGKLFQRSFASIPEADFYTNQRLTMRQ